MWPCARTACSHEKTLEGTRSWGGCRGEGLGGGEGCRDFFLQLPLKPSSFSHLHLFSLLGLVNTSAKTQKKGGGRKWVAKFGALMVSILDLAVPTMNLTTLGLWGAALASSGVSVAHVQKRGVRVRWGKRKDVPFRCWGTWCFCPKIAVTSHHLR